MSDSLRLSVPDLESDGSDFFAVADAAAASDGYDPFNEQARYDLRAGKRSPVLVRLADRVVGAAIVGGGELDLVIAPDARGRGYGALTVAQLLTNVAGELTAWSHGDHPAARALATRFGFERVRELLQLRADEDALRSASEPSARAEDDVIIEPFRTGIDDDEWVALNARTFAAHPEQGSVTVGDLHDRMTEDWFQAGDFLVARDRSGRILGYNWLKLEPDSHEGEIYVLGVDPSTAGRGLGRQLMRVGLARMLERGRTAATLYVEADNPGAVHLYRSLGFDDHTIDVQYRRSR